MSAEARIVGYSTGQPETLSLNPDYTLPAGMSHSVSTELGGREDKRSRVVH